MDDVWSPTQLAHGFQNTTDKKQAALVVVGEEIVVRIVQHRLPLEVGVIVDEVDLNSCGRDGSHFDDQRVVRVVHIQIHP